MCKLSILNTKLQKIYRILKPLCSFYITFASNVQTNQR